jgi:hypothetical protein
MKIGIITPHFAKNYGAVLQAYAMQTMLRDLGHEPQFVHLRLDHQMTNKYTRPRSHSLKNRVLGLVFSIFSKPLQRRFERFEEFLASRFSMEAFQKQEEPTFRKKAFQKQDSNDFCLFCIEISC